MENRIARIPGAGCARPIPLCRLWEVQIHGFVLQIERIFSSLSGFESFDIDQRCTALRIIILLPPSAGVDLCLIEPDRACISGLHVQPYQCRARQSRGLLNVPQQCSANSLATRLRSYLDGLKVGRHLTLPKRPHHNGKARHPSRFLGNPGGGLGTLDELPHVSTAKALGRREARFFKRVELHEVLRCVRTIEHSSTLWRPQTKEPSREGWLFAYQ